jgi:NAD(P)H dehydrogenase (quinone)
MGAAGDGRISSAARADYARAAATVLAGGDYAGRIYELAGDASFTLSDLVAVVTEASGKPIAYQNMTPEEFQSAAVQAGAPEMLARILSDTDAGVAKGALFDNGGELARLIGRPTTPFKPRSWGLFAASTPPARLRPTHKSALRVSGKRQRPRDAPGAG